MLEVRDNEIALRKWSGGTAHAHLRGGIGQKPDLSSVSISSSSLMSLHNIRPVEETLFAIKCVKLSSTGSKLWVVAFTILIDINLKFLLTRSF